MAPEVVVIATGGVGVTPVLPGIALPRVADVRDWLERRPTVPTGETVTIWGADRVGLAAADAIATGGAAVLLVGAQAEIAPEAGRREKILAVPRLQANPRVQILLGATVEVIDEHRILVGRAGHREWLQVTGPVLVSQGIAPDGPGLRVGDRPTYVIGEAGFGASADDAIREGATAGRAIR